MQNTIKVHQPNNSWNSPRKQSAHRRKLNSALGQHILIVLMSMFSIDPMERCLAGVPQLFSQSDIFSRFSQCFAMGAQTTFTCPPPPKPIPSIRVDREWAPSPTCAFDEGATPAKFVQPFHALLNIYHFSFIAIIFDKLHTYRYVFFFLHFFFFYWPLDSAIDWTGDITPGLMTSCRRIDIDHRIIKLKRNNRKKKK